MLNKSISTISYVLISLFTLFQYATAETIEVNFAYIGEKEHAALLGAKQGLEEANLQGQFLNQKYNLDVISDKDFSSHDLSKYIAVLVASDKDTFKKLSNSLPNTPVFNLSLTDDELRTSCLKNGLHIIPSDSMHNDAIAQWKQKKSDSNAKSQAWHPDFVKFAARDLNKRFKKAYEVSMNDYSWSGWAAVKMTSDTVARTHITEPEKMLNYLKTELTFDGQKGSDMNFRKTGQLRQLLLLIENDEIVAEAPVRGVAKPPTLDSLGLLNCNK
jgi:hypothetical protein